MLVAGSCRCFVPAWLGVYLLCCTCALAADKPRARTLTHDATGKGWVEQPPPPPGTSEGDLHAIRAWIREGKFRKVLSAVRRFVKKHGTGDAHYPPILLCKAEAMIGREDYDDANDILQTFLSEYGGSEWIDEALRLEFIIAEAYLGGTKREFLGLPLLSGEDRALRILDEMAADYPEKQLAVYAIKTKGDYFYANGEHVLAELEYERLVQDYPSSRYHPFALRRSADTALAGFGGVDYDEGALVEAQERYIDYRRRYPGLAARAEENIGLILSGIRQKRAAKELAIGQYYERSRHYGSAVFYYESLSAQWPDTLAALKANERLELLGASAP